MAPPELEVAERLKSALPTVPAISLNVMLGATKPELLDLEKV